MSSLIYATKSHVGIFININIPHQVEIYAVWLLSVEFNKIISTLC